MRVTDRSCITLTCVTSYYVATQRQWEPLLICWYDISIYRRLCNALEGYSLIPLSKCLGAHFMWIRQERLILTYHFTRVTDRLNGKCLTFAISGHYSCLPDSMYKQYSISEGLRGKPKTYQTFVSKFLPSVLFCFQPLTKVAVGCSELLNLILMKAKYFPVSFLYS